MDSFEILNFVQKCCHLKHKFLGVFAADNFPGLKPESFIIVNASESSEPGTHWLLLTPKQRVLCRPPGILSRKLSRSFQAIVSNVFTNY